MHAAADLGTARLDRLHLALATRGTAGLFRIAAADKALVEHDLAAMRDGDIDLAALCFARLLMLPRLEIIVRPENDDVAPSGFEIGQSPRLNRRPLRFPKGIGVGEIALVAEQVGDDLAGVGG